MRQAACADACGGVPECDFPVRRVRRRGPSTLTSSTLKEARRRSSSRRPASRCSSMPGGRASTGVTPIGFLQPRSMRESSQIDHLVITHYHADHVGGAAQLAARLPIRHFIDRGAQRQRRRASGV